MTVTNYLINDVLLLLLMLTAGGSVVDYSSY